MEVYNVIFEKDKFIAVCCHEPTMTVCNYGVQLRGTIKKHFENVVGVWQPKGFHSTYVPTVDTSQPITKP